ncbi:hypothetical protein HDU98_005572 [Podochytrium sp. JEL0797]|nr:hypothetical protein HDU98_005572 [Podochytrium sp. JEL0797]
MSSFNQKFKTWANQDVNNLGPQGYTPVLQNMLVFNPNLEAAVAVNLMSRPHELHDCRMRPKGQIADLILDVITIPTNAVVPVQTAFEAVDMIRASYRTNMPLEGALRAAQALNFRLYSNDHTRVHHTLVTMDILYRNCGIIFVAHIALYAGLLKNFIERKTTSQSNMELCIRLIAEWQTIEIDRSINFTFKDFDPIEAMTRLFENLVKAKYPIPEKSLENIHPGRLAELRQSPNAKLFGMMSSKPLSFSNYKPGSHVNA